MKTQAQTQLMDQQEDSMIPTKGRCNLHLTWAIKATLVDLKVQFDGSLSHFGLPRTQNPTVYWINLYLKRPLDQHEAFLSLSLSAFNFEGFGWS